jgi:hypothetical protein
MRIYGDISHAAYGFRPTCGPADEMSVFQRHQSGNLLWRSHMRDPSIGIRTGNNNIRLIAKLMNGLVSVPVVLLACRAVSNGCGARGQEYGNQNGDDEGLHGCDA